MPADAPSVPPLTEEQRQEALERAAEVEALALKRGVPWSDLFEREKFATALLDSERRYAEDTLTPEDVSCIERAMLFSDSHYSPLREKLSRIASRAGSTREPTE